MALRRAAEILKRSSIESYTIDAQLILCHCLGRQKSFLFTHPEHLLTNQEAQRFFSLIQRRSQMEPVAYIIGEKEFWSRSFLCTQSTLIPRPETELVVQTALDIFAMRKDEPEWIMDLGTGTGCIGISLALEWPNSEVILTDIDPSALLVAKKNCTRLLKQTERMTLVCCEWFEALATKKRFHLITANPPYISNEEMHLLSEDVTGFEPWHALFSKKGGFYEIERIFRHAHKHLVAGGVTICEIGWKQGKKALEYVRGLGVYKDVFLAKDLSGHDRVIVASVP